MRTLRRVAVLGAGTMGARIAAHFANAGVPVLLLDLKLADKPKADAAARAGLDAAIKQKPGALYTPDAASLIQTGNFDDDLTGIAGCDWVIEAVAENLEIKRALLARVAAVRKPGSILSTNTSGIRLAHIAEGLDADLRAHFLGTHFFNPPRYLHLVEVIPGAETSSEVLQFVEDFCDVRLGKGAVRCKDTPNFIANRIGSFFGGTVQQLTLEEDLSIEEVDALTGPLIGLPKSASYRLLDIVGLDIWMHVGHNLYEAVPHDPWRERFRMVPFVDEMIRRGWLGEKRGQGFYKRRGKDILALDRKTMEYRPQQKPRFASVDEARNIDDLGQRLRRLIGSSDQAGTFLWKLLRDHCLYAAAMVPEISDRVVEIDRAMRWGYANKLGPFETWDALGVKAIAARMEKDGLAVPESVQRMLKSGATSFYQPADQGRTPGTSYFDLAGGAYRNLEARPGITVLSDLKRARGVVKGNGGASLIDLGDGVLCLEFHSKMNTIGEDLMQMIHAGLEETARGFEALVIANQGENFSAGANLMLVLMGAQEGEWEELGAAVHRFQQANMAIKYSPKPVVTAPFGLSLGGACEIALHSARIQASAELYMGMVETGVGVIPGGGGCKEMILRDANLKRVFELIGMAKVSGSAAEARQMRLLRPADGISMNPERLIDDAKRVALALAPGYSAGVPRTDIPVAGEPGYALMKVGVFLAREANHITEYDAVIGLKLAHVLSGGRLSAGQTVSEQYLLDLEREAFLSLCGDIRTQQRMQHMLKTGKPLRN